MNLRQIKLDLTVKLMNLSNQSNALQVVQEAMANFRDEVGGFIDTAVLKDSGVSASIVKRTYAIRFEKCTLNLDLVMNQQTQGQYLNGFQLN